MTAVLTAAGSTEGNRVEVPAELRQALSQHIRAVVAVLADHPPAANSRSDQQRQRHLAALAATYPLETVITEVLADLRLEQAQAAAFAGASYTHLGEAAGVTRGRAQQMWPSAGKFGKRRKWLKKHQRRVRAVLRGVSERWSDLGPATADQDEAAIAAVLATDPDATDLTALDQALRAAQTILSGSAIETTLAVSALQQQVGAIAAAVEADQPLPSDSAVPAVLEFPGLPAAAAPVPPAPAWHGDFPAPLTSAITAVLHAFGRTHVRLTSRVQLAHHRLEAMLGRLRAGVADGDHGRVREVITILLARPVGFAPDADPVLVDAVRELKSHAEILLICPTCQYRPERESHPEERAMHLDFLNYSWLDLVDGEVAQRRHCPECQPTGYSGIDLACPWCEQGYFLEPSIAQHRANLPGPILRFLADQGWHTEPVPVHAACLPNTSRSPLA